MTTPYLQVEEQKLITRQGDTRDWQKPFMVDQRGGTGKSLSSYE
jgi:hypothetical protein